MCTQLFDPKVDYVFKNIFGSEKHPSATRFVMKSYDMLKEA